MAHRGKDTGTAEKDGRKDKDYNKTDYSKQGNEDRVERACGKGKMPISGQFKVQGKF